MKPAPYSASSREQQLTMAILAHAARHDEEAITDSLNLLAKQVNDFHPICVIAALLAEFQRSMCSDGSDELAQWFSGQALELASQAAR